MKVNIKRPNITQYYFDFEPGDEIHWRCMWARINLDHDTFTMTATSDCGDYSYRWQPSDHETFTHLMARVGREYLLRKISDQSVFDFEESKRRAVEDAKSWGDDIDAGNLMELQEMERCSEEMFIREVADLTGWEYASIPVEKRFPAGAEVFATVFCDYLQPILRKELQK